MFEEEMTVWFSSDPKKYPEGFTGEADATYSNGDKYGGDWKDGVSTL